jgi:hypothetical protein
MGTQTSGNQDTLEGLEGQEIGLFVCLAKNFITVLKEKLSDDLDTFRRLLDSPDSDGVSLMHYFTALDQPEMLVFLHGMGASVNLKVGDSNFSPLVIAAARGFDSTVLCLMKLGA